ncbi:uncharacterized protein tasor2 isoform X3 [Dicentrarchus labrax]|uniref:uncharacterized protein tasor2 isoform X3 n=1 Tax=Dicentrarchus labrax TaxID=13489 RepID=UPI0021F576B9|nr:uncharacterized protein tasor2 isoform X3 [Dicentrarchus labrax]
MESANGGVSSKGVLVHVSASSEDFKNNVLAPLKSAYLYEESKQSFRYKSAVLIKNPALERKYNAFRARRREEGYSEEDLKESYGFLLFDDVNKANALGETGVLAGNSTCTTLGDPSKGVYISMYSDCLDQNRWYHGKSGYIAIIRLTKGRVKRVLENYTQNFTAPTEGFDCHVSEQLPSVSSKTSSFLAFERTQYYMYELPGDGSNDTALSPSGACPFAIVPFSYTDTKATLVAPQEKSEEKKLVCHYFPWSGQLQIGTHCYDVGLRSTAGALIPAELPPVVKVDRAISMLDLRQLLPRTIFETCLSGEVFLDGLHCSLYEMVSSEVEETSSLSLLLWEIKEKDVALIVPLNDGGFLILLHSSHFFTYDDSGSSAAEVLQGMFVFPESRVIYRGTKGGQRKPALSSEILRVLPVLSYAEGEVEKTPIDPSEELCEVFAQHMQSYAALINPGLALSPSRDISIFPDQYDVQDAHKHLYSSPEWTNRAWQSFRSYLSKPDSFQLPVSKASEILAAGQQERIEDLDDDVYFCLSSPEEAPANHVSMDSEDQLTDQKSGVNVETSVDSSITSAEAQVDLTAVSQNAVPDDLQAGDATKDTRKSDLTLLIKADDMGAKNSLTPSTSDDLPAELIVSITSAERTLTARSVISTESADETVKTKEVFDCSEVTNLTKTNGRKLHKEHSKGQKHVSKACNETPSLQTVNMQVEDDNLKSQKEDQAKVSSGHPQLSNPSNTDWRKVRRRKRIFGKLSAKNKKVKSAIIDLAVAEKKKSDPEQQSFKSTIVMELDPCPHRKKTERWDLKPVISTCGRILVPHGYVDIADQIKTLKDKSLSTKDEQFPENMLVDDSVNAEDRVKVEKESSTALETAVDKTEATTSKGGGNHPQNVDVSNVSPEHSVLRQSEDGSGLLTLNSESSEHHSKNDGINTPFKTVQEKHTDTPSSGKCAAKGEFLLSKLKSVLLRGKRKTSVLVSEETTADTAQDTQPCLKKGKVDSDSGKLKSNETINPSVQEVSKMVSVDPLFAFALGLTPKETPDKIQKSQGQDTQQRKDSSETQEQTILDKQPQIIQRPLSIFPRRSRIKTLKKHQGVSAEHVRKKCTPFQVSPLSGSTRLLHHHQTMYGDGIKTLHPCVDQEDGSEHNSRFKKHMVRLRKFRHSRTFVNKDGSIQVTRQWKENYDFNLDSKFTCDSKDKAIIRALHGPWDYTIQDTNEEVRLIVHMWIGLFYSRSTARFFHVDSNSSEGSDSLEKSHGMMSAPAQTEFKADPFAPFPNVTDTTDTLISKALDLSKKNYSVLDQGTVILDLSLRNSSAEIVTSDPQVNKKMTFVSEQKEAGDTLNSLKSSMEPQNASTFQCYRKSEHATDIINEMNNVQSTTSNKRTCTLLQKAGCLEHTDVPPFKGGGIFISVQEDMVNVSGQPGNHQTAPGIGHVLHGCNNEKTDMKDGIENSQAKERILVQRQGWDSFKPVTDKDSNKKAGDVVHVTEPDEIESKDGENREVKEKPYQEGTMKLSPKMIHKGDESTNKEPGIVCNGNILENEMQSSREEPKTVSPDMTENVNEDMDCFTVHKGKVIEDDHFGREDGLDRKDCCISDVEAHSDLNNQPLPMSDGPDSVKEDCVTECNRKAPLDEHPSKVDNKEDAPHDLQLRTQCANGSTLTEENVISEKAQPGMEPVHNEPTVEENPENGVCLAELNVQPLPMSDGQDSAREDCITECNLKAPLDKQPAQADNKEDTPHYLQLRTQCANGSELTEENAISENVQSGMEPVHNEPTVEENPENGVCLADLNDHPLPMMCDGPDSVKDCITECNRKAPLDEQLPKADNKEHARYDLQLRIQCSDGSVLTEENAISEKAPTGMEPIHNKPAGEENQENGICLADLNDQPLPMMCDGPDSVKDCVTKCNLKAPLDKQPSQADNKEDSHHDLQLRTQCANGSELTEENAISENAPSAMEPVHNKPAVEENPENGICLADLNDQLLPMICDGPDSVKKDNITECNRQAPLNEQPPKTDNKENACYDLQLRTQCGNGSALTEENAISENTPSGMEPIHNKPAVEESPENGICLADLNDQPIPMMCDNPDSVKKDCITECNHQEPLDEQLSQADNEEHACHDLEFRKLCGNGSALTDEHTISEKTPNTQSEIYNETVAEENSEKGICLADKAHYQEAALPTSDERTCSLDGSSADGSIPQINDSVEIGSPNKVMANFSLSSADHEDGDAKSVEEVSHLPECKGVTKSEAEVTLPKEMALKSDTINKGLEKIHCRVVIPFIGIDTSGEDAVQPHDSHSECKVEEFQGQKGIPFISDSTYPDTVLPTEICSTSQLYSNNSELFDGKISLKLLDVSETNQPEVSGSESDDRCPTPTMDEKPYQYVTCSGPSSSSVFSGSKTGKNMTQKCLTRSSSFLKDKMPLEQKHKSTVNSDPNLHFGLHPDLELRTLRVLQSIDKFLFKSSHTDNASQIKTGDVRHSLDQIPNTSSKYIPTCLTPSHIFADFKGKKISNTKSVVVSACTSQELQTESSGFKSIDSLQAIKPNVDQDKHKTTLHTNLSHEPRSYSQRPVMAVKPSKSDEVQGDCILKDRESENSVMSIFSKDKPTKSPVVPYTTPAPMLFKKKTESLEGNSEGLNDNQQEASELSNSDLSKFGVQDPSYKGRDIPSSFLPMQSFEYAKTSSKLVDENQIFLTKSFDEKIGQMAKESIEMDQKDCPGASTSVVDYKDDSTIDDSLFLGPESSLTCTVYNTGHDRSYSFLEQLSQRCLQDDLTRASMEQECLIFSQQMQQLLKRSKRGPIHQLDEHDKFNLSSSSPVTVHFSSLEEQEDSVDHLDALSLVGQKIKVDMSDTKDLADTADEGNALHPQNLSEGTGNQMEHAGVSGLTAECARQYTAMMNDVVKRVPSRPKHFRMDRGYSKTEQSNHFDFCGQMKREMDESFRSSLNSVVKKSCKTKYRFYILVTSDDAFFEETKAQLEAEGHSAVQPSDFFLGDDSSSSLLIILKNEDIAEHICEVPHLLELKKSPSVQFAGIDEPDDVVNLTHQELFMRGGFIMFDRAALESLSLCNMKKMAEILQELSRTGKWKWMLHYRDSRRLKENARLTAEAKEKKHFINWCQEVGILEALPYHECDLMSRDQPDYLTCLVRLQVQNISARYPIFITDTTTDIAFGTNGILTMNFNSFLTCSPSETFTA